MKSSLALFSITGNFREFTVTTSRASLLDPTFILSNQLVERPIPLTTSTVAGRVALAKKRKASTSAKTAAKKTSGRGRGRPS